MMREENGRVPKRWGGSRVDQIAAVLVVSGATGAAILATTGGSLVPLWTTAIASLFLCFFRWLPAALSAGLATATFFASELLILKLTPLLGVGMLPPHVLLWSIVAIMAAVIIVASPAPVIRLARSTIALGWAATAGAIVFVGSMVITRLTAGVLWLSWAMNGDAVNAMVFARGMLRDGGIDLSNMQPTPLPFALAAAAMEGGRNAVGDSSLLEHDVSRTAQMWIFVITLTCLLVGGIVAYALRKVSLRWSVPVVAVSSCALLVWYVIGVQFTFGFMNTAFALVLLCASWLIYISGEHHPLHTLAGFFIAGLGILAVWSPLMVCVAGLGIMVIISELRQSRRYPGRHLAAPVIAGITLVAYGATVTVPGFLAQPAALGGNGGFPAIGPVSILVIVALCFLCAAASPGHAGRGAFVVIIGFALGLSYLLSQRPEAESAWGYYPAKFAWTTSILLIVMIISIAAQLILSHPMIWWRRALLTTAAAGVIASLLWGPVPLGQQLPLASMITTRASTGAVTHVEALFRLSGRDDGHDVLWRTTGGDFWANSWLLQLDREGDDPVRPFAYIPTLSTEQMCKLLGLLGNDVTLHTSDPTAQVDLSAACPDVTYALDLGHP
ncbi:MAG: hypothetical protein ACRCSP_09420 [Rhodoglobus sp.]